MSFSIDIRDLKTSLARIQQYVNQFDTPGRFVVQRITTYATVTIDVTPSHTIDDALSQEGSEGWHQVQKALDWQPDDHDGDRDELQVLHYLKRIHGMNPYHSQYAGKPTCNSLHGTACADYDGPLSSYRRLLWRTTLWERPTHASFRYYAIQHCSDSLCRQVLVQKPCNWAYISDCSARWSTTLVMPRQSDASVRRAENWVIELEVVDLYAPSCNYPLTRQPSFETSALLGAPHCKRFNGTRYRMDRKRWLAETRVPHHKHKVSFGTFKSEEEAARAVDAAYFYYEKPLLINFPDSSLLMPPAPEEALENEAEKLNFVKEQAQRMATLAFTIPARIPSPIISTWEPPCEYRNEGEDPVNLLAQARFSGTFEAHGHGRNAVQITEVGTEGEDCTPDGIPDCVLPSSSFRSSELLSETSLQVVNSPRYPCNLWDDVNLSVAMAGSAGSEGRECVDLPSLSDDCFDCLPDDPFLSIQI